MSSADKIMKLETAVAWRAGVAGSVVFTNGVFDLIHPGHVEMLEASRAMGDALIVGINSDESARRLAKGTGRPFVAAADRCRVVAALAAVDCIVRFDEDTPQALIEALRPDVLVKGADYRLDQIVGADLVRSYGGRVERVPLVSGHSSSSLVERIRASS